MADAPGRPWLASYAPGVPHELPPVEGSLYDLIRSSVEQYGDHVALEFFEETTTYAELGAEIERAAEGLRLMGVQPGDPVAIVLPNCPQHIVAFYAVLRLGGIVVEHNPLYTPRELRHQFEDHGARVVIAWDKVVESIQAFPDDVRVQHIVVGRRDPCDAVPHARHAAPARGEGARVPRGAHHERARHHPVARARGIRPHRPAHHGAGRRRRRAHPVHERHDRQPEGRRPSRTATCSPTRRRRGPGCPRSSAARRSSTRCCRCSTRTGSRSASRSR